MIEQINYSENEAKTRAFRLLKNSSFSLFLTGKAGTGKTTFLSKIREELSKRVVVAAPTGVAAMNAKGVTIHSLFQLPFAPYIPGTNFIDKQKIQKSKIQLFRSIDLLVLDEISMVRADTLDAISAVLRRFRDPSKPFGGVQLLMIGDIQQLSPVVKEDEWTLLSAHYTSPYFYSSKELQALPYFAIELKEVYRQQDSSFLDILNSVREGHVDDKMLARLNERCFPEKELHDLEDVVTLTTHNFDANRRNEKQLGLIDNKSYSYTANVEGDFPAYMYPTDLDLILKKDAQVMFIQNDTSLEKRYYNGLLGRIIHLDNEKVVVKTAQGIIEVEKGEWQNSRYKLDNDGVEIEEEVIGKFKQLPLRLAWAITIHKSQGLTFDKVIINANSAFAHGQVYVALSRCRSLEGIYLTSPISRSALIQDRRVEQFQKRIEELEPMEESILQAEKLEFFNLLVELFDFTTFDADLNTVQRHAQIYMGAIYPAIVQQWNSVGSRLFNRLSPVGLKFKSQLHKLIFSEEDENLLMERVKSGANYFLAELKEGLAPLTDYVVPDVDNQKHKKALKESYTKFFRTYQFKLQLFEAIEQFSPFLYYRYQSRVANGEFDPVAKKMNEMEELVNEALYMRLREWRNEEARQHNIPAYTVMQQKALVGIANRVPTTKKELLAVKGVGKTIVEKYGEKIFEIIDNYRLFHS